MLTEKYFFLRKTQPQMLYGRQAFLTSVITSIAVSPISWQGQEELTQEHRKSHKSYNYKFTTL